jgi:SAM-dependent methyltransferase
VSFSPEWEQEAKNWIAWARKPGHDEYWRYRDAFFELVPPPGRATLEVGSGEGRVARDLAARGHRVTGVDASPTLLRAATDAHADGHYVLADAAALPFEDASFDLVVAYNSLMDVQDMPTAVREAARVLEPGGRFCVCVTHPLANAGRFAGREPDAPFVIEGVPTSGGVASRDVRARRPPDDLPFLGVFARGLRPRARGGGTADRGAAIAAAPRRAGARAPRPATPAAPADVPHAPRRNAGT